MASKYARLNEHLIELTEPVVDITFDELDAIVGGLPLSARRHYAWWANTQSAHDHARSWLDAGRRASPKFADGYVRFALFDNARRHEREPHRIELSNPPHHDVELNRTLIAASPIDATGVSPRKSSPVAPGQKSAPTTGVGEIAKMGFLRICAIDVKRDEEGVPMEYLPQGRYDNQAGYKLNPHGKGPFCQFQLPTLSESAGVYAIVVGEEVVYIGECQNLSERYGPRGYGVIHPRNCYVGGQSTNCKINARVLFSIRNRTSPALFFLEETRFHRKDVERDLVNRLQPRWNGRG